jgi:hypothetical protein
VKLRKPSPPHLGSADLLVNIGTFKEKVGPIPATAAVGFCLLQAMFSLEFLAFGKIAYHVIGRGKAIDAIDKSDWPALPCPVRVRVTS